MSTLPPEQESPVSLRAATRLSTRPAERPALGGAVDAQPTADGTDPGAPEMDAVTLAAAGAVLAVGVAWVLQRRRQLARQVPPDAPAPPQALAGEFEPSQPQAQRRRRRRSAPAAHRARKLLMKFFMALRSVAGALAILAAIAIVVFWSIELIDSSARESGLTLTLLGFLLAGGAGYWCSGRLANMLHRSVYNRDHPKFAD